MRRLAGATVLALAAAGCEKVPLTENPGDFALASLQWFENEKVAYLFFALEEDPERLLNPEWQLEWNELLPGGGAVHHARTAIDFDAGVHEHRVVPCGKNRTCGSFSFRSEGALSSARLRFVYDKSSPLDRVADVAVNNHVAGDTSDAYSALAFGTFDAGNEHLLARFHHNFGSPPHLEYPQYGMTRRFRITRAHLAERTSEEIAAAGAQVGTELVFPATLCANAVAPDGTETRNLIGKDGWLATTFPREDGARGACYKVDFLDKNDTPLLGVPVDAYARRNPELSDGNLTLVTPLRPVIQLPVVVRICDDDRFAASMIDKDYFDYQRYILGFPDRQTDVCFRLGDEKKFAQEFEQHVTQVLAAARQPNPDGQAGARDYIFVVLFHERFSNEFREVHKSIAEALTKLVNNDADKVSPRLVAGFVYGSTAEYQPSAAQRQAVLWCPQFLLPQSLSPNAPLADQNCTILPAQKLDLRVINFIAPLGPLPSLKQYREYVDKYGDKGLAKSPKLNFVSVPTTEATRIEPGERRATFFDNERYAIAPGEFAKVCAERLDVPLDAFYIRTLAQPNEQPSLLLTDVNALWQSDDAAGEYRIGLSWDYPFTGGITYTATLTGNITSVIPFQKSQRAYDTVGDTRWTRPSWNFGSYIQHCYKFCDNPYFDEAGAYQAKSPWRDPTAATCPAPLIPVWDGGGGG